MQQSTNRGSLRAVTLVVATMLLMVGPDSGRPEAAPEPGTLTAPNQLQDSMRQRPECGYHDPGDTSQVPLSGPITNIPEFHDCQRFIHGGGYIARYAIFVAYKLDSLIRSLDPDTLQLGFLRDTLLYPEQPRVRVNPGSGAITVTTVGVGIATIYNYGTIRYDPLGIEPGFNCLNLFRDPKGGHWRAKVVPMGQDSTCTESVRLPDAAPGKELTVRTLSPIGFPDSAYPPVARWDWDPVADEQYIGIKCGRAWCEIGDSGFASSREHTFAMTWPPVDPAPGGSPTMAERMRVVRIKGWYDEERLAVPSPNGALHPGSAWGAIFPHPVLGRWKRPEHFENRWVPVASAVLEGTSLPYSDKLNFAEGTNRISLCQGSREGCSRAAGGAALPNCPDSPGGGAWWTKIVSATGRTGYHCVVYRSHAASPFGMPAAARWRWSETDQKVWVRCAQGCCELQ